MKSTVTVFALVLVLLNILSASLFKSNLGIYEVHNNGTWYNFGHLFGLACIFGGGGNRSARRTQQIR